MGTYLTQPSPSDFDKWEERLAQGEEPSTAAKAIGRTASAFRRADLDRHAAALEMSREARGNYVDERMEQWAIEDDAPPPIRLAWAKRWQPEYAGNQKVDVGVKVEVERREVSLHGVLAVLADAGALDGLADSGPLAALVAARPVLPAQPD